MPFKDIFNCTNCGNEIDYLEAYVVETRKYPITALNVDGDIGIDWGSSEAVESSEQKADFCCPKCKMILGSYRKTDNKSLEDAALDTLKELMDIYVYRVRGIGVDSGTILIADREYYQDLYDHYGGPTRKIVVPEGTYKASWQVHGYEERARGTGQLNVTTGEVWISDPCYIIPDVNWCDYLEKTNYFEKMPEGVLVLNEHGGDGQFRVVLELDKQEE